MSSMSYSLYVCDFPQNIDKDDLTSLFESFDGFQEARIARDKNGQKIAFVDFGDHDLAKYAQQQVSGYRFPNASKGINIRFSDHNKRQNNNGNNGNQNNQRQQSYQGDQQQRNYIHIQQESNQKYSSPQAPSSQQNGYFNGNSMPRSILKKSDNGTPQGGQGQSNSNQQEYFQDPYMHNIFLNGSQKPSNEFSAQVIQQVKDIMSSSSDPKVLNDLYQMIQSNPVLANILQSTTINAHPLFSQGNSTPPTSISSIGAYDCTTPNSPIPSTPSLGQQSGNLSLQQSLQSAGISANQLMSIISNPGSLLQNGSSSLEHLLGKQPLETTPTQSYGENQIYGIRPQYQPLAPHSPHFVKQPPQSQNPLLSLNKLASAFKSERLQSTTFPIPHEATCTVYVEGLPEDASDREVAHIFRPFPGFRQLRLIPRETKDGQKVHFAFADFENTQQTTMVINTLQGYRFHKDDLIGLQFSYAVANNRGRRNRSRGRD